MASPENETQPVKPKLGMLDAASVIVGIIIGSTIYETAPLIFSSASDPWIAMGLWAGAGVLAFIGALCYAELGTTYPRDGGDYNYLTRAYGPLPGYLFGWAQLVVVQTGSIGLMAYVFASYMVRYVDSTHLWDLPTLELFGTVEVPPTVVYATAAIVVLTLLNMVGVVLGKLAQNLLTLVKILGLGAIIVAGFFFAPPRENEVFRGTLLSPVKGQQVVIREGDSERTFKRTDKTQFAVPDNAKPGETTVAVVVPKSDPGTAALVRQTSTPSYAGISFALVLILLAYGGYNDAAFVAAEVRERQRNLPRALFLGTLLVMAIYLLVNGAYLRALGFEHAASSSAIAADTLKLLPGEAGEHGERLISILVMVSALGAVNGLIFTSSRIYATMGSDYSLFAPLSRWSRGGTPLWSLLLQMLICLAMAWSVGTPIGRDLLNEVFKWIGVAPVKPQDWGQGGFEPLLKITAPMFWLFFLMTGLALFVLRINDAHIERPFQVPLFPITPLLFCAMCGFMLHSGINYAGQLGLVGGGLVLLGVPFYVFSRRRNVAAGNAEPPVAPSGSLHKF